MKTNERTKQMTKAFMLNAIIKDIKSKLEKNKGLTFFAKERSKFEGWLKVEVCDSLSNYCKNIIPEKDFIDITFGNWAIELKTVNTTYGYKNVANKSKPITDNVKSIIKDIQNLKKSSYANKAVIFIVFPAIHNRNDWQYHLKKVSMLLKDLQYTEFCFKSSDIPGVIYFGTI